jgi:hypothetical protein
MPTVWRFARAPRAANRTLEVTWVIGPLQKALVGGSADVRACRSDQRRPLIVGKPDGVDAVSCPVTTLT